MPAQVLLMLPDFALIIFGAVLARTIDFGEGFWSGVEKLVYYVLFPPLLFYAINTASFSFGDSLSFLSIGIGTFLVSVALGFFARPLLHPARDVFASSVQTAFRFNSYIGLAIAGSLYGTHGVALMALLVAICVPVANVFAVMALSHHAPQRRLWRDLASNPLIISTVLGLLTNLAGMHMVTPLAAFLQRLGDASLALGLMTIGAGLQMSAIHTARGPVAYFVVVRLLAVPLVAAVAIYLLRPAIIEAQILILFAALPTASSAYVLATRMGGNGAVVAVIVTIQTLLSMATLPLLVWLSRT